MAATRSLARRFAASSRGNVAMIFALTLPVLVMITMGGVDINRAATVKGNLQDALDAAALAAARSPAVSDADLTIIGTKALRANLANYPNVTLASATFSLNADQVVISNATVNVKTLVANIVLPPYGRLLDDTLPVGAHSEVNRSSKNIEVALAMDVSGSMSGQKILELKEAAKDLIDLVVQPDQTPYYSKVALVPWSDSVNPGTYLNAVRGSVTGSTAITGAAVALTGTQRTITAATRARPVVITSAGHGFANGDLVWISNVSGMTQLNNQPYVVTGRTTNTFQLYDQSGNRIDGRTFTAHSGSAGRVQRCLNNPCAITVTSTGHGLANNDYVYVTGVNGMTQINGRTHRVSAVTANTYAIPLPTTPLTPYTSGGLSWCAQPGCTYYAFTNQDLNLATHRISPCVTERLGSQAFTDAAPTSSARVGRLYPNNGGTCLESTITPLSSSISGLKDDIDDLEVSGSTAGQIGIAWGWYMVSPNFGSLWPSASAGAAYTDRDTLKAVVIMTDGEFNAPYCNGVMARWYNEASSRSNNCDPNNGDPYTQSRALCDAMKAQGVLVYTVGFQIGTSGGSVDLLRYCASATRNFFNADSGTELSEAFQAIGRDISQIRISR